MKIVILIFIIRLIQSSIAIDANTNEDLERLNRELSKALDRNRRPVLNENEKTEIVISLIVNYFKFNEESQEMTIQVSNEVTWFDHFLRWNPQEYGNIKSIAISEINSIWTPGFQTLNTHSNDNMITETTSFCNAESSGAVDCVHVQQQFFTFYCQSNLKNWPFDKQICSMDLGKYYSRNSKDAIDLENGRYVVKSKIEFLNKLNNPKWQLVSYRSLKDIDWKKHGPGTYTACIFEFELTRHSASIVTLIHMPILSLIFLNLITLLASIDGYIRIILAVVNLQTHFYFQQYLGSQVYSNGDIVPDIFIFVRNSLFLTVVVILETVLLQNLCQSNLKVPKNIKTFITSCKHKYAGAILLTNIDENLEENEGNHELINNFGKFSLETDSKENQQLWKQLSRTVNGIFLIILIVIYLMLYISLFP